MTTVHVDTGRDWGGGQAQVLHLASGLARRGVEAIVVAPPDSPLAGRAAASGLELWPLPLRGEADIISTVTLARRLRARAATVVHAHTAHAVTIGGVAGRLARTPLVVAARRVVFPISRAGRLKLTHLADVVICVSQATARATAAGGVPSDRLVVVGSGVEIPAAATPAVRRALRAHLGCSGGRLIGAVGSLLRNKDHATLIEAAHRLNREFPEAHFVILGEGPLEGELRQLIAARGLADVVRLAGFVDDAGALLAVFDLFVLPSRCEGLGTSVLDAMAARVPVVASNTGGVPEMIEDGVTGLLVSPGDATGFATAIRRLLTDAPLAGRLRTAAHAVVTERYSATAMTAATLAVYRARLGGRGHKPSQVSLDSKHS